MVSEASVSITEPAGVGRRVGAILYDSMLVIAILAVATVPFIFLVQRRVIVPREVGWPMSITYWLWLVAVLCSFFVLFWCRRGQTLGMQVWKIRMQSADGTKPTALQALARVSAAAAFWLPSFVCLAVAESRGSTSLKQIGLGLLILVPLNLLSSTVSGGVTWHERWSATRTIRDRARLQDNAN